MPTYGQIDRLKIGRETTKNEKKILHKLIYNLKSDPQNERK